MEWGWDGILPSDPTYSRTTASGPTTRQQHPGPRVLTEGYRRPTSPAAATELFRHAGASTTTDFRRPTPEPNSGHPSGDRLSYVFGRPVLGGEFSYRRLHRLSRGKPPIRSGSHATRSNTGPARSQAPAVGHDPANCLSPRRAGTYNRGVAEAAVEAQLHRSLRAELHAFVKVRQTAAADFGQHVPGVSATTLPPGDSTEFRAMPTVGLEYRYPFISVHSWGTPDHRADRPSHRAAE